MDRPNTQPRLVFEMYYLLTLVSHSTTVIYHCDLEGGVGGGYSHSRYSTSGKLSSTREKGTGHLQRRQIAYIFLWQWTTGGGRFSFLKQSEYSNTELSKP